MNIQYNTTNTVDNRTSLQLDTFELNLEVFFSSSGKIVLAHLC